MTLATLRAMSHAAQEPPDLLSAGKLCEILQVPHRELRDMLEALHVHPALFLNSVPHYDASAVARLRGWLASARKPATRRVH